ncbi:MAG: hypothetical protein H6986_13315 [Pseudomonadales bacterium]|nr:hypothetical protein [Pseudomonadales bacterium]
MKILGINYFFHDSSACIVDDGELVVALEEERFSRSKHTTLFPHAAIARCLEVAGCGYEDIDHVAVSINPTKDWHKKSPVWPEAGSSDVALRQARVDQVCQKQLDFKAWYKAHWPAGRGPTVHNVDHHLSHIAGSFFVSPMTGPPCCP